MRPIEAIGGAVIVLGLAINIFGPRLLRRVAEPPSGAASGPKPRPRIPNTIRKIATKTFRKRGATIDGDAEDDGEDREEVLEAEGKRHPGSQVAGYESRSAAKA